MPELAWINGMFCTIEEAVVPINDRGLQFGDGAYEVIRSYQGQLWAADPHFKRLQVSLDAMDITRIAIDDIRDRVLEAFTMSQIKEALIYIQVTRGVQDRNHIHSDHLEPSLLITVRELEELPAEEYRKGVTAIMLPDTRWARRDIKSLNLLANCLAMKQAARENAYEPILFENGLITEAASCSVFMVKEGAIITREAGAHILSGITRAFFIELADENGIPVQERPFTPEELAAADEIFFTASTFGSVGVIRLDGRPVGPGSVGPVTRRLHQAYKDSITRILNLQA
ncbi:aminotransferase class IV [Planctomycetota bacterium]